MFPLVKRQIHLWISVIFPCFIPIKPKNAGSAVHRKMWNSLQIKRGEKVSIKTTTKHSANQTSDRKKINNILFNWKSPKYSILDLFFLTSYIFVTPAALSLSFCLIPFKGLVFLLLLLVCLHFFPDTLKLPLNYLSSGKSHLVIIIMRPTA